MTAWRARRRSIHTVLVVAFLGVAALSVGFLSVQRYLWMTGDLRALADLRPDVVLLDIDMPGLNGVELLPALQALAPGAKVVMVSGTPDVELSQRALALGAFDFVPKPIDLAYLRHTLETAIALRRLEG